MAANSLTPSSPARFPESRGWRTFTLALALVATYGCTGGLSCGGAASGCGNNYAFPQTSTTVPGGTVPNGAEFVDDGMRLRMTQQALDFIVANIRPILGELLGNDPNNPENILISSTSRFDIGAGFSVGQGVIETHPTEIYINAQALADSMILEFVGDDNGEPTGIRMAASDVPIGVEARVFSDFGLGDAACDLFGTNDGISGRPFLTTLTIDAIITPRVGTFAECDAGAPQCLKIDVQVNDASIGSFGSGDIEVDKPQSPCSDDGLGNCSEECSDGAVLPDFECDAVCFIGDIFTDIAAGLADLLSGLINGLLPGLLESQLRSALDDFDGAPIAVSSRMDLASLAPGVLPESSLDLGFAIGPTSGAFAVNDPANTAGAQGMDMIFKSGFEAAPAIAPDDTGVPHPCVRRIEGQNFADLYGGFQFEAPDAEPLTGVYEGTVYSLAASLAKASMNQLLFGMYNTGALCLEMSTDSIHQLTGGGFTLNAGLVNLLAESKLQQFAPNEAPAIVVINPSQPPVIDYGAGNEEEGHLIVNWPSVEVGFYVLINERFSRVFAVATDISMQLSVFNDPATSSLRIAVIDGPNIENFVENYNELLPGVAFTEVLEAIIGTAFDAVLGDGLEFNYDVGSALADALGVPIYIDFLGLETIPEGDDRQFLNVYLLLTDTPPSPFMARTVDLKLAHDPGVLRERIGSRAAPVPTGEVHLEVDPFEPNEYFALVDFGAWRGPLRPDADGTLVVRDPKLRIVGEHTVTLRARVIGEPNSLEQDGPRVTVWVDGEAPRVTLRRVGAMIVARGTDSGTAVDDLRWQWSTDDDGDWEDGDSARPLAELSGHRIAVRAIDRAGNVSQAAGVNLEIERMRLDHEAACETGGCTQSGVDGAFLALLGGLGLAGAVGAHRRRRARA